MNSVSPPEWYLDIEGARSGPYTTDQIEGFLKEGEILPRHRVISSRRPGQSVSVGDFVTALHQHKLKASPEVSEVSASFQPPPRPQDIHEKSGLIHIDAALNDPAYALFDALQVARERKMQNKLVTPSAKEWGALSRRERRIPAQVWLIAALTSVLWISVWGVLRLSDKSSTAASARSSSPVTVSAGTPPPPTGTDTRARPIEVRKSGATETTVTRGEKPRLTSPTLFQPTLARPAARIEGAGYFGRNLPAPASAPNGIAPLPTQGRGGNTAQQKFDEPPAIDGNPSDPRDAMADGRGDDLERRPLTNPEGGERIDPLAPPLEINGNQAVPID